MVQVTTDSLCSQDVNLISCDISHTFDTTVVNLKDKTVKFDQALAAKVRLRLESSVGCVEPRRLCFTEFSSSRYRHCSQTSLQSWQ